MKVLGLIPARGGSKGVPGKNIRLLGNKPLINYTIEAALEAASLTKIIVSTDSLDIAVTAKEAGVEAPFLRPVELAQDHTPTLPVIQHVIHWLKEKGESYDAVCLLQPTNPFRPVGFIDRAIKKFIESGADSLVSVLPVPTEYNPHWVFEPIQNGYLKIATGESRIIPRRQELPVAYFRDGSVYITKTNILLEKDSLYGDTITYIEADPTYHVNIDTLEDWKKAEELVTPFYLNNNQEH